VNNSKKEGRRIAMRTIKYKVYDHKLKMLFDVTEISRLDTSEGFVRGQKGDSGGEYYVTCGYLGKQIGLGPNGTAPIVNRFVLREFTGLTDKNSKEIYEGDIVYFNDFAYDRTGGHVGDNILYGKVHYDSGMYLIRTNKGHYTLCESLLNDEELEVIGNIYENPELLKTK
jgi:uncharacterized phage protein (TIGR01671 family)